MNRPKLCIVVAIGKNRELGKEGKLLWNIPDDMRRFKALTKGHPVIMGRKTFESILGYLGKPLPERTNIVVTRNPSWKHPGVFALPSLAAAMEEAAKHDAEEIHVGGGAELYAEALPLTDSLRLTCIAAEAADADTYFPEYQREFREVWRDEEREWNGVRYQWVDMERNVTV